MDASASFNIEAGSWPDPQQHHPMPISNQVLSGSPPEAYKQSHRNHMDIGCTQLLLQSHSATTSTQELTSFPVGGATPPPHNHRHFTAVPLAPQSTQSHHCRLNCHGHLLPRPPRHLTGVKCHTGHACHVSVMCPIKLSEAARSRTTGSNKTCTHTACIQDLGHVHG